MTRLAIVTALEALDVGDVGYATEVLVTALEDGPAERRFPCRVCGVGFEWPGLLDHHLRFSHALESDAA